MLVTPSASPTSFPYKFIMNIGNSFLKFSSPTSPNTRISCIDAPRIRDASISSYYHPCKYVLTTCSISFIPFPSSSLSSFPFIPSLLPSFHLLLLFLPLASYFPSLSRSPLSDSASASSPSFFIISSSFHSPLGPKGSLGAPWGPMGIPLAPPRWDRDGLL